MPQIETANIIAERLNIIALLSLMRPPVGPYDEPTEELVIWAVHNYAYSSIAHYRTILDGLNRSQKATVLFHLLSQWIIFEMQVVYL
jgi:hypothetical protein